MQKRWLKNLALITVLILVLPLTGFAQGWRKDINAREREQQGRIRAGIRSGELTRLEAARLEAEEARIRLDEARARHSGGVFTPRERAQIQRELNHASRDIYRQTHDRQDRR
jgi:hypothetical protein